MLDWHAKKEINTGRQTYKGNMEKKNQQKSISNFLQKKVGKEAKRKVETKAGTQCAANGMAVEPR